MFRKIINPKNRKELLLQLPEEFVGQEIEVIAFAVDTAEDTERSDLKKSFDRLKRFIGKNTITLPEGYQFDRDELYD